MPFEGDNKISVRTPSPIAVEAKYSKKESACSLLLAAWLKDKKQTACSLLDDDLFFVSSLRDVSLVSFLALTLV